MESGQAIWSFDQFIREAVLRRAPHLPGFFISGESLEEGLRHWWRDVAELEIVDAHVYCWTCPGCGERVTTDDASVVLWDPFEYVLWEHCPTCSPLLGGL